MRVRAIMATEVEVISENDFEIQSLSTPSQATIPTAFRVLPPAPNPFNPETVITFELPSVRQVKIEVFNRLGRRVSVLKEETMPAGVHRVTFNGANLSSGIYFIRVQAGSEFDIAKVALVR